MVLSVGRHEFPRPPRRPRRWSLPVAAVVIPAAAFLTAGATTATDIRPAMGTECCAELVSTTVAATGPTGIRIVGTGPTTATTIVAARAVTRDVRYLLSAGVAPEKGLQVETILAARLISAMFPEIHNIGGVRPDALRWHPNGLALDVMIPNYSSPEGKALGDRIAQYVLANADHLKINHVIWRQVIYTPGVAPRTMPNNGSDDANHYTHVHVATDGGGYPTGREIYFTSADGPAMGSGSANIIAVGAH